MERRQPRELQPCNYMVTEIPLDAASQKDVVKWMLDPAREYTFPYLLAHADDGVIWGRQDQTGWVTSHDAFPEVSPPLRSDTLQQARLFGATAELLVWRAGDNTWHARILSDEAGSAPEHWRFDEAQVQWGDHQEGNESNGFTLLADGQQELYHAVPLPVSAIAFGNSGWRPVRLRVRHYLTCDDEGLPFIVQSRLVNLFSVEQQEADNE